MYTNNTVIPLTTRNSNEISLSLGMIREIFEENIKIVY